MSTIVEFENTGASFWAVLSTGSGTNNDGSLNAGASVNKLDSITGLDLEIPIEGSSDRMFLQTNNKGYEIYATEVGGLVQAKLVDNDGVVEAFVPLPDDTSFKLVVNKSKDVTFEVV